MACYAIKYSDINPISFHFYSAYFIHCINFFVSVITEDGI